MGDVATFDVSALAGFAARLAAARGALAPALTAANAAIADQAQATIAELYGPRLAPLWQVDAASEGGPVLARVSVQASDKRVLFYEYGTRPHPIAVRSARALAFQWRGAQAFFAHVQHPGTRAHNHREALKIAIGMTAREAWSTAIQAALATT